MISWLFKSTKYKYVSFENVSSIIKNYDGNTMLLINTMKIDDQIILIKNTILAINEEQIISTILDNNNLTYYTIIIYGKNNLDTTVYSKYDQLANLGFTNIYIYGAGIFEWLLLRDIYGKELFILNSNDVIINMLDYKPNKINLTI